MKYIIDIDALKECLDLLPSSYSDVGCVELSDVKKMIDAFPKDKFENKNHVLRSPYSTCENCGNYG